MNFKSPSKRKKILFVLNELTYTGTPFMFLNCYGALKEDYDIEVWSFLDGEFSTELDKINVKYKIINKEVFSSNLIELNILQFSLAICLTIYTDVAYATLSKIIPTIFYLHESRLLYDYKISQDALDSIMLPSAIIYTPSKESDLCFYKIYGKHSQILPNAVIDYFEFYNGKKSKNNIINLLSLGYIAPLKNFELVINALNGLPNEYKNKFHYKFAGKNIDSKYLDYLLSIKNDTSEYLGEIKTELTKFKEYYNSDLIVVPSHYESCSLVALEAAMMGKPLIVTNEVGAKYIINDKNGWIISNDVKSLQTVLTKIIDDKVDLHEMGRYSRLQYLATSTPSIYKTNFMNAVNSHINKQILYSKSSAFSITLLKEEPLISIIVPVYNTSSYLNKCIDSIINQTYKNLEIILIDDGSTDNSGIICDEYQKQDNRVVVIHKTNGGLSSARNKGLDECKGEYVSFIDSDDYVDSTFIECLYSLLLQNNADISVCSVCSSSSADEIIAQFKDRIYNRNSYFRETTSVVCWNKLYSRALFDGIRFPTGKVAEDSYIYPYLVYKCNFIACTSKILYHYNKNNPNSISNFKPNKFYLECINTRFLIIVFLIKNNVGRDAYNYWFNDTLNTYLLIRKVLKKNIFRKLVLNLAFRWHSFLVLKHVSRKNAIKALFPYSYLLYKKIRNIFK